MLLLQTESLLSICLPSATCSDWEKIESQIRLFAAEHSRSDASLPDSVLIGLKRGPFGRGQERRREKNWKLILLGLGLCKQLHAMNTDTRERATSEVSKTATSVCGGAWRASLALEEGRTFALETF